MQLDFEKIFHEYVNANKRVFRDRTKTLGASETFACIRRTWFQKWGEKCGFVKDEDQQSWGATERGNIIENGFVVPALRDYTPEGELLFAGEDQETLVDELNSATPDGLLVGVARDALMKYGIDDIEGDCIVFEIKSIDPRVSIDEEKAIHHGQAQMQMGIIRKTTDYKPMYAVILYVDASFLDVIHPFVVKYDDLKYKAGKTRARILYEVGEDGWPGDLKAEGKLSEECRYCPWFGACASVTVGGMPRDENPSLLDESILSEAEDLISQERHAKEVKDQAEKIHKSITLEIKEFLTRIGKRKLRSAPREEGSNQPQWSISWSAIDGKETIDKDAAKAAGIDLQPFMKAGNPYDRLTIKLK